MPTFTNPTADADEAREAVRGLAHATRAIDDPAAIYAVLGAISASLTSMSQSLHQLAAFHDGPQRQKTWLNGASRAASYQASWELHRAAEMIHQVAACVDRAHEVEATITYGGPAVAPARRQICEPGLSL